MELLRSGVFDSSLLVALLRFRTRELVPGLELDWTGLDGRQWEGRAGQSRGRSERGWPWRPH